MNSGYIIFFLLFMALITQRKIKQITVAKYIHSKGKRGKEMLELAKSFIGQKVIVRLIEGSSVGVIERVENEAILLKIGKNETLSIINPNFILTITQTR